MGGEIIDGLQGGGVLVEKTFAELGDFGALFGIDADDEGGAGILGAGDVDQGIGFDGGGGGFDFVLEFFLELGAEIIVLGEADGEAPGRR